MLTRDVRLVDHYFAVKSAWTGKGRVEDIHTIRA